MEEKSKSYIDCDKNKTNGASDNSNKKPKEPFSLKKFFRSVITILTVEPYMLLYVIPAVLTNSTMQKFNLEKACRVDLNMAEDLCKKVINGEEDDNVTMNIKQQATILVADMTAWRDPLQTGVPALFVMFIGAWSDKTGNRKAVLLIPLVGEICSTVGLLAGTYFFLETPLWLMGLTEALSSIFTGGLVVGVMGSYSYLADITTPESRTFRIGVAGVLVILGTPLGTSISGVLTASVGYYGIYGISLAMYILGFIYTIFRIHDVNRKHIEGTFIKKFIDFIHPKNVWETLSLLFKSRGRQLALLLLLLWAHVLIMGPVNAESSLQYYYIINRYGMDHVDYTLFTTYTLILGIAGSSIVIYVFNKWLKWHDAVIGMIATVSNVASSLAYGLVPTRNYLFCAGILSIFTSSSGLAIRSLGTKIVEPNQVGRVCSLIGLMDLVVPVIYTPFIAKLFSNTVQTLPGAFYIVGSVMTAPAFFVLLAIYILQRRQQRDAVQNPEIKEMHVYDNDITAL